MIYTLENDIAVLKVDTKACEIASFRRKDKDIEYMWDGDPAYWANRNPLLFPHVSAPSNKILNFKGEDYKVNNHGFCRKSEFQFVEQSEDCLHFRLCDNEESRKKYPFSFELEITHRLEGRKVTVEWKVTNPSADEPLYFSIGGHPAFNCPVDAGTKKTDYFIRFDGHEKDASIPYVLIDQPSQGIDVEHVQQLPLDGGYIPITDTTFDRDAYIFDEGTVQTATLCYPDKTPFVTLSAPGFPSFGVWSKPHTDAPFVCLEPWIGRCDNMGFDGELPQKYGEQCAEPGQVFEASYTIEVH